LVEQLSNDNGVSHSVSQ